MDGLMMDFPLNLDFVLRRAETFFGHKEIATRMPDKSWHRYTYADMGKRAKKLALALKKLGVEPGDRVGTFSWNHYWHMEAYFGIPIAGGVLHTLNIRLHPTDLEYIINDAEDKVIIIDQSLIPLLAPIRRDICTQKFIVVPDKGEPVEHGDLNYEDIIAAEDEFQFEWLDPEENSACAMCYTSGTTGRPKGVLYSHRSTVLHSIGTNLPDVQGITEQDVVLPVVPMFHANAWGLPHAAALAGIKMVYPGPHLDPVSLLEDFEHEKVTVTAGVPTIWMGLLKEIDSAPDKYDLSLRKLVVGGSAVPRSLIEGFDKHGLTIVQAWGMTETSPLGSVANLTSTSQEASEEEQMQYRCTAGMPAPMVEIRAINEDGEVPWDNKTMGALEVRGPWVVNAYYKRPDATDRFSEDGWFRTGDIVTIDPRGYIRIQDRSKDLVKSGGEWISSVDLENLIMAHPAVAEAAVIALPHEKWDERPLAAVVLKEGQKLTPDDLREFLSDKVAKWPGPATTGCLWDAVLRDKSGRGYVGRARVVTAGDDG